MHQHERAGANQQDGEPVHAGYVVEVRRAWRAGAVRVDAEHEQGRQRGQQRLHEEDHAPAGVEHQRGGQPGRQRRQAGRADHEADQQARALRRRGDQLDQHAGCREQSAGAQPLHRQRCGQLRDIGRRGAQQAADEGDGEAEQRVAAIAEIVGNAPGQQVGDDGRAGIGGQAPEEVIGRGVDAGADVECPGGEHRRGDEVHARCAAQRQAQPLYARPGQLGQRLQRCRVSRHAGRGAWPEAWRAA
ncbi:hypothetical protein D3C86_1438560 [compost metagenome]